MGVYLSRRIVTWRRLRSRLDLLKPHTDERVESNQFKQKDQQDSRAIGRLRGGAAMSKKHVFGHEAAEKFISASHG